jgi:hypothetical protein
MVILHRFIIFLNFVQSKRIENMMIITITFISSCSSWHLTIIFRKTKFLERIQGILQRLYFLYFKQRKTFPLTLNNTIFSNNNFASLSWNETVS